MYSLYLTADDDDRNQGKPNQLRHCQQIYPDMFLNKNWQPRRVERIYIREISVANICTARADANCANVAYVKRLIYSIIPDYFANNHIRDDAEFQQLISWKLRIVYLTFFNIV